MRFDVVLVLYNSEKWLPACVAALSRCTYNLKQINLILVDNASQDQSVALAGTLKGEYAIFGGFTLLQNAKNKGFGSACNTGAAAGAAPYLFFLNVDTEVEPDVFTQIDRGIAENPGAGGFECRQLPYEMGNHVNPLTLETPWASGAAMVLQRTVFEQAGRFDAHLFMYCEDVDLSWRVRAAGFPLYYLPQAVVHHYVLARAGGGEGELREYANTAYGALLLSYKYCGAAGLLHAHRQYLRTLRHPRHFNGVRRTLLKNYLRHFAKLWPFLFWRFGNRALYKTAPAQFCEGFAPQRGREVLAQRITNGPKISVVVRTCGRPQVLRGALHSIRRQTYPNYEVVVVEDGPDTARQMVTQEFCDLPLRYHATGQNIGRGKAGNLGLSIATGQYLNFLDDDDYFYPDHLELMAAAAQKHPDADLVLGCAMVMKVDVTSHSPYQYKVRQVELMRYDRLDLFTMSQTCQIPIQSAIFKHSLYKRLGGLREDIEGNEDWAMWLRFLAHAKRANPKHIDVHRATSVFVLPASQEGERQRLAKYKVYDEVFFGDATVRFDVSLADMRGFYDDMIADMRHLQNTGKMDEFLKQGGMRSRMGEEEDANNIEYKEDVDA